MNVLYQKYITNITFKQFTIWCFTLWFYIFKITGKRKKDDTILSKNTEEQPNSVTIIISVDGKGTIFPVKLKLEGESFE